MNSLKKSGFWWALSFLAIIELSGWWVADFLKQPLIFLSCSVIVAIVAGYCMTKVQAAWNQSQADLLEAILHKIDASATQTTNSINETRQGVQAVTELLEAVSRKIDAAATETSNSISESRQAIQADLNSLSAQFADVLRKIDASTTATSNNINESKQTLQARIDRLGKDCQTSLNEMDASLEAIGKSFENSVEAYHELEIRMAALEQQNVHLQHLTTLVGTVRSDIAVINEIRGFAKEAKEGRKVRIVRDDENKIVVENLMNSDGIRIERSKMYRNKLLVFEAEFNDAGQMIASNSYDKDGNLDTKVTYAPSDRGRPTLSEVTKEVYNATKDVVTTIKNSAAKKMQKKR